MRVTVEGREYDLYLGFRPTGDGLLATWTMHTYEANRGSWIWTDYDVSKVNPFASTVSYVSYDKE